MVEKSSFAEALVKYRKEKDMTQKELAAKLNISDKAVSRWETGKNYPDVETLQRIAELLDITVNDLLKGNIKLMEKKSPYKRTIIVTIIVVILLYMFPFYNWIAVTNTNFYGAKESSYLLFRGLPSHHMQVNNIVNTAEEAFSDLGLSVEDAKKKYGVLGRYCITSDYDDVVREKHDLRIWSVMLDTHTSESAGYIWVCYDQEGFDDKGKLSMGSENAIALWCLEKVNDEWYVCDIKEGP